MRGAAVALAVQVKGIVVSTMPRESQSAVVEAVNSPPETALLIVYSMVPEVAPNAISTLAAVMVGLGVPLSE